MGKLPRRTQLASKSTHDSYYNATGKMMGQEKTFLKSKDPTLSLFVGEAYREPAERLYASIVQAIDG